MTEPTSDRLHRTADHGMSRRQVLGLGGAFVIGASIGGDLIVPGTADAGSRSGAAASVDVAGRVPQAVIDSLRPLVLPRSAWGDDLPPTGDVVPEDDVRFLLVHHTASTNNYGPDDVVSQIRGFHGLHTGPERGWPDVAYNFFVDRFGTIWEARTGSIDGPVRGDATGGSQGFAILCSLIGNHAELPVTAEAADSLVSLLAWLAERYNVDTTPGATVDFISRGSNRWAAGTDVRATTIAGHRDMSQTTCPGDFAYELIQAELPTRVTAARLDARAAVEASTTTAAPPTTESVTATTEASRTEPSIDATTPEERALGPDADDDRSPPTAVIGGAAAALVAVALAASAQLRRRPPRRL